MQPLGLTAYALAKACYVPRTRIERIAREEIGITADTALRLGRYFNTTPQFWLNLQADYDMRTAQAPDGSSAGRLKRRLGRTWKPSSRESTRLPKSSV